LAKVKAAEENITSLLAKVNALEENITSLQLSLVSKRSL